jgi:putative ABC transport system permease protein
MRSNLYENLMMALRTLRTQKLRSALTLVGVIIGVWTVMAIASIISGIDVAVKKEVESFGTRSIFIMPSAQPLGPGDPFRHDARDHLTAEDATAVAGLPAVELAVPFLDVSFTYYGGPTNVSRGGKTAANVRVQGTLPEYEQVGSESVSDGRFFSKFESDTNHEVCVIGETVAESLFWPDSPIGKALRIGQREFRVVGVLEARETFISGAGGGQDNLIYIPFGAALHFKPRGEGVFIMAVARHDMMSQAKDQITDLLRARLGISYNESENFTLSTSDSIIEAFRSITFGISTSMLVISSVALLVGGIGVMNIMLICVTERTREIGVRKALGACRRDILWQFLIEAMTLTGLGGLMGLALGGLTTFVIRLALPSYVPYWAPLAGFLASVGVGLVFGLWPAWKAARLNPIDALRYE